MIGNLCVILTKPQGMEYSTVAIRTVYTTYAGGADSSLILLEDGVYNALQNDGYNQSMLKRFIDEEGPVYCLSSSLEERKLGEDRIAEGIKVISNTQVAELIQESDGVARF